MLTRTEEWVGVAPADDVLVFSKLYNDYFPRIYNYVFYRVNDYHDTDDLTSEIFVKIFTNLGCYHAEKAPLPVWIFSIARNAVIDYYRRRARMCTPLEVMTDLTDSEPSPDDRVAFYEMQQHLREALASLPQREREIIGLKFWSGFSNRQIAGFTGISESNIGVILFRSMRRLRQILKSMGFEGCDRNEIFRNENTKFDV